MDIGSSRTVYWTVLYVIAPVVQTMIDTAGPEPTCGVSRQSDGSYRYRHNLPMTVSCVVYGWEDRNHTNLAWFSPTGTHTDRTRVLNFTSSSISMRFCETFLSFKMDCEVHKQVLCVENCSSLSDRDGLGTFSTDRTPLDGSKTETVCVTQSWCVDERTFGLGFGLFFLVLGLICVLAVVFCIKHQRRRDQTSTSEKVSYHAVCVSPS